MSDNRPHHYLYWLIILVVSEKLTSLVMFAAGEAPICAFYFLQPSVYYLTILATRAPAIWMFSRRNKFWTLAGLGWSTLCSIPQQYYSALQSHKREPMAWAVSTATASGFVNGTILAILIVIAVPHLVWWLNGVQLRAKDRSALW